MSTRLTGDVSLSYLHVKLRLTAGPVAFVLSLTHGDKRGKGDAWKYILCDGSRDSYNLRLASGPIIAPNHHAALRLVAGILGQGYPPGTIERGLFDTLATDTELTTGAQAVMNGDARP
jgi:hypothetical protein